MSTLEKKLAMRDVYLETLGVQLQNLAGDIERLRDEQRHIKPTSRYAFYHQLQAAVTKLNLVEKQYHDLSLAGPDRWEELHAQLDQDFAALNKEMHQTRLMAEQLKHNSRSWAKGMLDTEEPIDTIGWTEGVSEAEPEVSMGWVEGQAGDQDIETEGWTEGYAKA